KKNGREGPWEEWDGEYIGNIWGWKWSFISLGIILFVVSIMVYRHYNLTDEQRQQWEQRLEMQRDSIEAAEQ
ncbi:MAG: hypothetical protein AAFV25_00800, partial [Bacteroidota bacterium]